MLLLLLVSLLWPGKGLFSGSPEEKAKSLIDPANAINRKLGDPNNVPGDYYKPAKDSDTKLAALDMKAVSGDDFRMLPMTLPGGFGEMGRRIPCVFTIDEAAIKLARMQIQTYILNNNKIYSRRRGKGSGGTKNKGVESFTRMIGKVRPEGRHGSDRG